MTDVEHVGRAARLPRPLPDDVRAARSGRARDHRALPRSRGRRCCRCCTSCRPEEGYVTPDGHRALRRAARPDHGRGRRGRHLLHDVQAPARRRLPRRRLHQHAVRGDGRRRDLRRAEGAPRRRQRRDHRRRQGHPRAHRVQRGLRLRTGRDGQLGVLRQPDASRAPSELDDRLAGRRRRRAPPRSRGRAPSARSSGSWPGSRRRARPREGPCGADRPRWSGCSLAHERERRPPPAMPPALPPAALAESSAAEGQA